MIYFLKTDEHFWKLMVGFFEFIDLFDLVNVPSIKFFHAMLH